MLSKIMKRRDNTCSFIVAVFVLLSLHTILAFSASAETTKQKRERLKAHSDSTHESHEHRKSYFGMAYGGITSASAEINNITFDDNGATGKWTATLFVDARIARTFSLGPAFNVVSAEVFGSYNNSLYDLSLAAKFVINDGATFKLRPGLALGYGMIPEKNGYDKLNMTSKRMFVEADFLLTQRLGILFDAGVWWASGSNHFVDVFGNSYLIDVSGHCLYYRLGLLFI